MHGRRETDFLEWMLRTNQELRERVTMMQAQHTEAGHAQENGGLSTFLSSVLIKNKEVLYNQFNDAMY